MTYLKSILVYLLASTLAVLMGVVWIGYTPWQAHQQSIGYGKAQEAYLALARKAYQEARNREADWQAQLTKANQDANQRQTKLAADAAAARNAADSLRHDLNATRARLPALTREAVERYADAASVVFLECSQRYTGMAAKADGHAADQQTLEESWPQ